jgi:N-carbamoylputrescine amidase
MSQLSVTVCELPDDPAAFASDWARLVDHVHAHRTDLIVLPEMPFARWFAVSPLFDRETWDAAVRDHDAWLPRLAELSPATVMGSRPVTRHGVRLNEGFVRSSAVGYAAVHDKRYLPDEDGYWEARWYARGDGAFDLATAAGARVGVLICTEMWSLGDAERYGQQGAQLLVTPRATGRQTVEKWIVGGRAAAIVSGAFSLSSNRSASGGEGDFGGAGWIIDPDGRVLATTGHDRPFVTERIDLALADEAKRTYPRYSLAKK